MTDRELAQSLARVIAADIRAERLDQPTPAKVVVLKPKKATKRPSMAKAS